MSKTITRLFIIAGCVALAFLLLRNVTIFPSLKSLFRAKAVTIEETPVIIKEIKSLAQLMTVTYSDEVVMSESKKGVGFPSLVTTGIGVVMVPAMDRLVIIGRGKVIAGVDLERLTNNDIRVVEDSISVRLPPASLLQTIINPSGFETFIEDGEWAENEIIALKNKMQQEIARRAIEQRVLDVAGERSQNILRTLLENLGYKKVTLTTLR